jgi:hypothetical protein
MSLLIILLFSCESAQQDTASSCPAVTDVCMDQQNHQECLDVESTCNGELLIMESCPLQFGCDD